MGKKATKKATKKSTVKNIATRDMQADMKAFIKNLQDEAETIDMKSYVDDLNHSLQIWPSVEDQRSPIQIVISINLNYLSIYTTNINFKSLNPYILDFIDILCTGYGYKISSSGIRSGTSEFDLALGSIWAILAKE